MLRVQSFRDIVFFLETGSNPQEALDFMHPLYIIYIYTLGVKNEEYPPLMCNTLAEIISESLLGPERSEPIPEWFSSVVDSLVAEFNDDAEMGADYARRP